MTGGGLYILVAYGSQYILLCGNPDFTYFYLVLKIYSHFSFESVTIQLDGPGELLFDAPIKVQAKIQRVADLLSDLYLTFTLPINNNTSEVAKSMADVEKFAGKIKPQIAKIGHTICKNPPLNSLIFSCLRVNDLARNRMSASLAKSDV